MKPDSHGSLVAAATGRAIARVGIAASALPRMTGLLGRDGLAADEGLVLTPCSSIHTWFMRFPIDVIFVDRGGRVLRVFHRLGPFRLAAGGRDARQAIELAAGAASRHGVEPGTLLSIETA